MLEAVVGTIGAAVLLSGAVVAGGADVLEIVDCVTGLTGCPVVLGTTFDVDFGTAVVVVLGTTLAGVAAGGATFTGDFGATGTDVVGGAVAAGTPATAAVVMAGSAAASRPRLVGSA